MSIEEVEENDDKELESLVGELTDLQARCEPYLDSLHDREIEEVKQDILTRLNETFDKHFDFIDGNKGILRSLDDFMYSGSRQVNRVWRRLINKDPAETTVGDVVFAITHVSLPKDPEAIQEYERNYRNAITRKIANAARKHDITKDELLSACREQLEEQLSEYPD